MLPEEKKRSNGAPAAEAAPTKKLKSTADDADELAKSAKKVESAIVPVISDNQKDGKPHNSNQLMCDEAIITPIREAMEYNVMPSMELEQVATGPYYTILVMFTSQARVNDDQTATTINFVYLGRAQPGFTKAPYEPEINPKSDQKHKIYVKDGKPTVKAVTLNEVFRDEEAHTTLLKCNSFNRHPSPYFANRGRGEGTEKPVGYLKPGVPINCMLFVDGPDTKFADEEDKKRISAFSLGHLIVTVPRVDRSAPKTDDNGDNGGYGLQVKRVQRVFADPPPPSVFNSKYFLTDTKPIGEQLEQKLNENAFPDKVCVKALSELRMRATSDEEILRRCGRTPQT